MLAYSKEDAEDQEVLGDEFTDARICEALPKRWSDLWFMLDEGDLSHLNLKDSLDVLKELLLQIEKYEKLKKQIQESLEKEH